METWSGRIIGRAAACATKEELEQDYHVQQQRWYVEKKQPTDTA
jgi:hypothetical protein